MFRFSTLRDLISLDVHHRDVLPQVATGCEFRVPWVFKAFINSTLSSKANNEGPHLMIHLCTCTGDSASTISSSKRRGGTVSCKNCGGRPAIDGKSPSSCLLSTVLELTSLINSDFTWTKVSKGCRSASRRPRRSNTINIACGGLLAKDSTGLEMPVSESEKLGVSVLGCHFSEKAEHIPIKKRRFIFRASSPPSNIPNPSLESAERHATSPKASSHGLQLNPNTTCVPAESEAVTGISQRGSNDDKLDEKELVKASKEAGEDDDFSGISILAAAACSNSLGAEADRCEGSGMVSSVTKSPEVLNRVELQENNVKSADICKEESDSHTSTTPSKGVLSSTKDYSPADKLTLDNSSPDESTLDNSFSQAPSESVFSKSNEEASITQKSSARDVRLNWDLNTVMDAWEEPFVGEHGISASDAAHDNITFVEEKNNNCIEDISGDCELGSGRECGTTLKTTSNLILPVELKSLAHENEELKLGNHKPDGYAEITEPLSHEFDSAQDNVVKEPESLHSKQINSGDDSIPVTRTLTLENPTHGIFSKWVNLGGQRPGGLGCTEAVDTELSMDCSVPPGFDHLRASKENVGFSSAIVGVGNNSNLPTSMTQTIMTVTSRSEYDKDDLSLTPAASLDNGADQSGVTSNKVDDEAKMKMELTSNVVAMEDLVSKGTDLSKEADKGGSKVVLQTTFDEILVAHSSVVAEDQSADISPLHEAEVPMETGFGYDNSQSDNRAGSGIDKLEELSVGYDSQYEDGELRESSINAWKGYEGNGNVGENEYDMDNMGDGYNLGIVDAQETSSQCGEEGSSRIKFTDVGSGREADLISNVLLPEKLQSSDEVSGSGPNEMISGQENSERQDVVQHPSQSYEWKMNVSGWDLLPENQRISSNNFTKTRNFSSRKFSYREQKDGFETEDLETKAEGSRFYRKEPLTRIGGPSTRDMFLNRGGFRMQGCSSKAADGLTSRPERESGALRSFGRGRYSPRSRASGRGGGMWNRSPERGRDLKRLPSPSFQRPPFLHSVLEDAGSVDNMTSEGHLDPSDAGRPNTSSYVTRRPFRSRSPMNREENDFRARLGLRPTGDTSHDRFVNMGRGRGRGRTVRYGSRLDDAGPRGRYLGPANEECDEFLTEYSHPYPRRRRCFSPIERRANHSYDSRSPSRPRTRSPFANTGFRPRSRSPNFRPDARMRRPRSPNYRRGFEADHANEYNPGPRNSNSSPPSSRWVNYKERPAIFDRRSPPPGRTNAPQGERFSFYDSSRKPKQNEYYRSGHPGRFSDLNEGGRGRPRYNVGNDVDRPNNGYRRGGFVRRYNMEGGPAKRFQYEDEDGFGRGFDARDKHALELHARGNPKPCSNGTDSRFRDFPRRPREDREMMGGDFKRQSREGKDPSSMNEREPKEENEHIVDEFQRRPREVMKDQSTTNPDSMPNEVVKEGDKPTLGSN
ncbi:uncharacterized protein LOC112521090 isoform X2 [Cynara cardunculus var. scolymus]|uniref:uncharacterized protein LOC112521090 isoform X2 n=1 Tax=Cynara cardunculus var. scolymus TaxID=59895 RepID=UPI000D62B2B9|nr:uncharacterized protein LOC112521090 isoform X2 [Cynara cardunculus var. scolymus]